MCFEVTNTTDKAISIVYSQWVTTEIVPEEGTMSELVLPSGLSAVVATPARTETKETRHRETIPPHEVQKIRYASGIEDHPAASVEQMADHYWEADQLPEPGPI